MALFLLLLHRSIPKQHEVRPENQNQLFGALAVAALVVLGNAQAAAFVCPVAVPR